MDLLKRIDMMVNEKQDSWEKNISDMSSDNWELYNKSGVGSATKKLNDYIIKIIKNEYNKKFDSSNDVEKEQAAKNVHKQVEKFMKRADILKYGAGDTEPRYKARKTIAKAFGINMDIL